MPSRDMTWCASTACPRRESCARHTTNLTPGPPVSMRDYYITWGSVCGAQLAICAVVS